jgi:hypothetical protein
MGQWQIQTSNNLIPNRKSHHNIPNEKLTFPLKQGGPLPSTAGVKNRNRPVWNGILWLTSQTDGKQQTAFISPPASKEFFLSILGRKGKSHGKNGWQDNGKWVTIRMSRGWDEGGTDTGREGTILEPSE